MRVLAFATDDSDIDTDLSAPSRVRALARVDVVSHPALGNGVGRPMSARHEQDAPGLKAAPSTGQRLENAIWSPSAPDVLVAACPDAYAAVPDDIKCGLTWIHVLLAWRRLQPMVPLDTRSAGTVGGCFRATGSEARTIGALGVVHRRRTAPPVALRALGRVDHFNPRRSVTARPPRISVLVLPPTPSRPVRWPRLLGSEPCGSEEISGSSRARSARAVADAVSSWWPLLGRSRKFPPTLHR